jgi:hypothetical protein
MSIRFPDEDRETIDDQPRPGDRVKIIGGMSRWAGHTGRLLAERRETGLGSRPMVKIDDVEEPIVIMDPEMMLRKI